jgi:hypothetical protein
MNIDKSLKHNHNYSSYILNRKTRQENLNIERMTIIMSKIKIISYTHLCDVEEIVNGWIAKNNVNILSIKYSTCSHESEIWHNILIYYEPGKE